MFSTSLLDFRLTRRRHQERINDEIALYEAHISVRTNYIHRLSLVDDSVQSVHARSICAFVRLW